MDLHSPPPIIVSAPTTKPWNATPHILHGHLSLSKMRGIEGLVYQPHEFVLVCLDSLKHLWVLLSNLFQKRLKQLRSLLQRTHIYPV
jgi:hypothetical protein